MEKTIGVLGATGLVGNSLVNKVLETSGNNLIIAGRTEKTLQELQHRSGRIIDFFILDATNEEDLRRFYAKVDLVVNCLGPSHSQRTAPAKIAIEASIPYLESGVSLLNCSEKDVTEIDANAQKHYTMLVTGVGFFPGLSRVLLQYAATTFYDVDHLKISVIFNNPLSAGSAVDMLLESRQQVAVVEKQQWIHQRFGSQGETICFSAPFLRQRVYASPPVDTLLHFPKNIRNFTLKTGTGSIISDALLLLHSLNTRSFRLTEVMSIPLRYASTINRYLLPYGCAMRMDVSGEKKTRSENALVTLYHADTFVATASVIALGVDFLLKHNVNKAGVFTFGEVVNPPELLDRLRSKDFIIEGI